MLIDRVFSSEERKSSNPLFHRNNVRKATMTKKKLQSVIDIADIQTYMRPEVNIPLFDGDLNSSFSHRQRIQATSEAADLDDDVAMLRARKASRLNEKMGSEYFLKSAPHLPLRSIQPGYQEDSDAETNLSLDDDIETELPNPPPTVTSKANVSGTGREEHEVRQQPNKAKAKEARRKAMHTNDLETKNNVSL